MCSDIVRHLHSLVHTQRKAAFLAQMHVGDALLGMKVAFRWMRQVDMGE